MVFRKGIFSMSCLSVALHNSDVSGSARRGDSATSLVSPRLKRFACTLTFLALNNKD
jgi:hypothetical protein